MPVQWKIDVWSLVATLHLCLTMMKSSHGNIFRVTGPLFGEFTGHRWIPSTKANDAEHWCFLWFCARINGWVNNGEAGDLRCHRAHYDVTVITFRLPAGLSYQIPQICLVKHEYVCQIFMSDNFLPLKHFVCWDLGRWIIFNLHD